VDLHRDLAAHRQSGEDEPVDAQLVEQADDVAGKRFQLGFFAVGLVLAVAAEVRGDDPPPAVAEVVQLWSPHRPVERVAVDQDQCGPGTPVVVRGGHAPDANPLVGSVQ
jgi:hypothetical protein